MNEMHTKIFVFAETKVSYTVVGVVVFDVAKATPMKKKYYDYEKLMFTRKNHCALQCECKRTRV